MVLEFDDIQIGDSAERTTVVGQALIAGFADLVDDHASVHTSPDFAKSQGFDDVIAHGFLIGSLLSGILGEEMPGPRSVINSLTLKFHRAVPVGTTVVCRASVKQRSDAVGAIVLALTVTDSADGPAVSGSATCSFPRRS